MAWVFPNRARSRARARSRLSVVDHDKRSNSSPSTRTIEEAGSAAERRTPNAERPYADALADAMADYADLPTRSAYPLQLPLDNG